MSQGHDFRVVLVVFFAIFVPIGIYHRIRSQSTGEKLDRRQEGLFILATLRPVGIALWVGVIAYMVNPASMAWSSLPLATWLRWMGVVVLALACTLLVWTFRRLGKNLTDTVVTRQKHTLVIEGPYRWVRHPFYDCAALLSLAISLIAANWFFFVAGAVMHCLFFIRTRTEERNLLARFGGEYQAYRERTGRFLPRIFRSNTS